MSNQKNNINKTIKMNIYALNGHKVKCSTFEAGYDFEIQIVKKYLKIGAIYTVSRTDVHSSSTTVYLHEFPNISFNSVFFEDAIEQSEEDDKKHPDYFMYN